MTIYYVNSKVRADAAPAIPEMTKIFDGFHKDEKATKWVEARKSDLVAAGFKIVSTEIENFEILNGAPRQAIVRYKKEPTTNQTVNLERIRKKLNDLEVLVSNLQDGDQRKQARDSIDDIRAEITR